MARRSLAALAARFKTDLRQDAMFFAMKP